MSNLELENQSDFFRCLDFSLNVELATAVQFQYSVEHLKLRFFVISVMSDTDIRSLNLAAEGVVRFL